jgi:formate hydrogenlyase transcriptional activator
LRRVVEFDGVATFLHDAARDTMRVHLLESELPGLGVLPEEMPLDQTSAGWVWREQQPLLIPDIAAGLDAPPGAEVTRQAGVRSACILPLTSAGRRLGALGFGSRRVAAYSENDLEFLQQVANHVAIAVDNALNFERAQAAQAQLARERDRSQLMLEINNAVVSELDLKTLVRAISDSLREVVRHDATSVAIYDPAHDKLRVLVADYPNLLQIAEESQLIPLEGSIIGLAFTTGQPIFVERFDLERFPSEFTRRSYEAGIRSGGNIPLIAHGRKLGILGIGSLRENAFSAADIELLCQGANQIAIAVENALNFESAQTAQRQLARERDRSQLLLEVNNAVVSHLSIPELLRAISACLRRVMPHDFAALEFYDPENQVLLPQALDLSASLGQIQGGPLPVEGTGPGKAVTSRQTVLVKRLDLAEFPAEAMKRASAAGLQSGCSVPLISHGQVLGTLDVASLREAAFSEDDAELFTQIGNQVAIAVDNALNYERARKAEQEVKRKLERERLMLEINNAVVSHLSLRDLVRATSSCLREVLQHDVTGISLYEPETNQFRAYMFDVQGDLPVIEEGTPLPVEGTVGGLAFTSGQPVFINRIGAETATTDLDKRFYEAGMRSGGCVPLVSHGQKLGVLGVASYREDAFSESDQELLVHIANQIAIAVENSLAYREIEILKNKLNEEKLYLEDEIRSDRNFEEIIGASATLKRILKQVETVAPTDSAVLIRGETGTGKELIARAIHSLSARRERTLVKLNCAAIPTGLLESELFGHEKGAFTGAIAQRIGRFELANKGTLFLDEVGDIPLELQPKLLRVLQEQEFERLGSARTQRVDVRLVAATNCDLEEMVAAKQFRGDLFYRLNVFPITIPPLRERREDIPLLVRSFAQRFAHRMKKRIDRIPTEAMTALTQYHWPGNVRELENLIERAVILSPGPELEISITELKPAASAPAEKSSALTLEAAEREHILRVLRETDWVVSGPAGAAARLGMNRSTLQSRMRKLGIARPK